MIIDNHTDWKTEDLRRLFSECCDRIGIEKAHRKIKIFYGRTRSGRISGRAFLFSDVMTLKLPNKIWNVGEDGSRQEVEAGLLDTVRLAQVFMHEAHHNLGLTHPEMVDSSELDAGWATPFAIQRGKKQPAPKVDYSKLRYERVLKRIGEKETKIKRLHNSLKKLQRRKAYYEKDSK